MSPEPMVVASAGRPRSLNVVGEQVTVLASGEQTGSFEIFFQSGPGPVEPGTDEPGRNRARSIGRRR